MANFPGTNIPISSFKGSDSKKQELINRLNQDMSAGDIDGMNDAIFSVAYHSVGGQGKGQGNANVSKIHNGSWKVTADVGDNKSWAESSINSNNDVYIQTDGAVISYDDNHGTLKDGVSTGTWGGQGSGENNPHSGDAPPKSGVRGAAPVGATISGDQSGLDANMLSWIRGVSKTNVKEGPKEIVEGPVQEQMNLLSYRPWTQKYADKYMTGGADSLMTMDKTSLSPEYSIAYQPGEFRDPNTWAQWADDHKGHIPEGAWRRATMNPWSKENQAAGTSAYTAGGDPRQNIWAKKDFGGTTGIDYRFLNAPGWNVRATGQSSTPWDFTAPAHSQGNVAWQDWTPKSMNLTTPDRQSWEGLLKAMDTSPEITPGLLSIGRGGPISFDGKSRADYVPPGVKKMKAMVIDN